MVELLLDLSMIPRKVQGQLQPQQEEGAKRRFNLELRINWKLIALIMSLKNYLTLTIGGRICPIG